MLDKIIAQNTEAVANGKIIASNTALTASEGSATLATGAFTTAIKANIKAMITWMTTTPLGWLTMLVGCSQGLRCPNCIWKRTEVINENNLVVYQYYHKNTSSNFRQFLLLVNLIH